MPPPEKLSRKQPRKQPEDRKSLFEAILEKNYANFRQLVEASYALRSNPTPLPVEEEASEEDQLVAADE